ncbi:MAG TPA: SET domain-containing protein [Microlunatus sp.]
MADVTIGAGTLAGRGVYAARDFAAGEVVVCYRLQPLSEADYLALPAGEDLFVHSYGGRRFLYPAPARYVNHADEPTCFQDFDRGCDVALRPIVAGEPITIDATTETARELETFLAAYRDATQRRSTSQLRGLVAEDASLWRSGRCVRGGDEVVAALLAGNSPALADVEWTLGTGRWEALCSARVASDVDLHLTMLLKVITGNWQLVYQHLG